MPAERLPVDNLSTTLRRLELCTYAVSEIHLQLQRPDNPEKADLILQTESLVAETLDLYQTVRRYVWGDNEENDFFRRGDEDEEDD